MCVCVCVLFWTMEFLSIPAFIWLFDRCFFPICMPAPFSNDVIPSTCMFFSE